MESQYGRGPHDDGNFRKSGDRDQKRAEAEEKPVDRPKGRRAPSGPIQDEELVLEKQVLGDESSDSARA